MEFEAAAHRDTSPEPWNEVFEFQAPEPEQLNEAEAATQIHIGTWSIYIRYLNSEFLNQSSRMRDSNVEELLVNRPGAVI